ncbi:hypothetical protein [Streptomyces spiramenti]|uniref:Integral membrane protein n=1 Tax=Streptomyces spiramenti TaxID=2720606 RepID=A0ABX1AK00_9ACTN|nr:hypothetical protein [Streptomyces spiramenti]NJP64923.1 hypothetical protein [Streptomyces spiramenti]
MAQAVQGRAGHGSPLSFFNTDGNPHPRENALALTTAGLGLVALVTAFFPGLHLIASWAGLIGIVTGATGQMISVTTAERFVTVIGLGAAATGFYLGVAHGGPFGGLLG